MFKKSIVSLITPINNKGHICKLSLKKLVDYHILSGTSAIVSAGTTGESTILSKDEYYNIIMMTLELAENRIPIIAGISSSSTLEAINLVKYLNNSGVSGYLILTPYYVCPTQEGLFQHFKLIANQTDLPQIIYNVPIRTGCNILPKTVYRLSKLKNIIGIKDATEELNRVNQIRDLVSDKFILLSGNDATALDFIQLGGNGVISVTANVAAKDMAEMCNLAIKGYYKEARIINNRLALLHDKLFIESNPIPVKWACKKLGLINTDNMLSPMTKITSYSRKEVKLALKYANLI